MAPVSALSPLALLPLCVMADISATSQLFQLAGGDAANNVKLSWNATAGADSYNIMLRSSSGSYETVATAPGNTYDIYDLNATSTFRIQAMSGTSTLDASADLSVTPASTASGLNAFDNTVASTLKLKSKLVSGDTYYQYNYVTDDNGFSRFSEQTSTDGYTFTGDTTVLTRADVCASVANGFCKLESIKWAQHPTTGEAVMWAHFENAADYTLGQVAVAHGTPGAGNLTFGGAFRPTGDDSRDLTFFADDDGAGYLVAAIHTNTDLGLYALTPDWTNVTSKLATVQPGEHREAPALVRERGGRYYLFTSTAAGWYPSAGEYVSAASLAGPWTASAPVGNVGTFGAQSGQVERVGDAFVMAANRWAAQWAHPEAQGNRQILLPVALSADGFAAYAYYETVLYDDDSGALVPVQSGRVLSVGRNASSSGAADGSAPAGVACDGTQDRPENLFTPAAVPFWWQVDLGAPSEIVQVDVAPRQVAGSETYLQYNVTGSSDGESFDDVLVDEGANTSVGFRSSNVSGAAAGKTYRYVRVSVEKVVNVHNDDEADWAAGLHEVVVYGS